MTDTMQTGFVQQKNRCPLPLLVLITIIFPILAGCGSRSTIPTPTPNSKLVATSTPIDIQIPQTTINPLTPINPSPTPRPPIQLQTSIHQQPDDLFTLPIPQTWSIRQEQNTASFSGPQEEAAIYVHVVNTGYPLDEEAFLRLIEARENNIFSSYDDFIQIDRQEDKDEKSIRIKKQFSNQGVPKSVESLYRQQDQAIFILDFWSNQQDFEAYQDIFNKIIQSASMNTEAVSNLPVYSSGEEIIYQNDYFSIKIPPYWMVKNTSGEQTVVDTFYSPDEQAVLQTVIYDDGQVLSRMVSGNVMRTILREQYTNDIVVRSDSVLADGREILTWNSGLGNYQGITMFQTRGTALLGLTVMWDNDMTDFYKSTLENMIGTYKIHPSQAG